MATDKPIGGIAQVKFNGSTLMLRGELQFNFQTGEKKGVVGRDGTFHGFTIDPKLPFIEGDYTHDGSYATSDYEAITGATVTVYLADGRTLVLRQAYVAGEITVNVDEAKVK